LGVGVVGELEVGAELVEGFGAEAGDVGEVFGGVEDDGVGGEGLAEGAVVDDFGGEFFAEVGDAGEFGGGGGVGVDARGEGEGLAVEDDGVVEAGGAAEVLDGEEGEEEEEEGGEADALGAGPAPVVGRMRVEGWIGHAGPLGI
jgi:hypothetical protein